MKTKRKSKKKNVKKIVLKSANKKPIKVGDLVCRAISYNQITKQWGTCDVSNIMRVVSIHNKLVGCKSSYKGGIELFSPDSLYVIK